MSATVCAPHNIRQQIELAIGHHSAGQFDEAERLYREVLAVDPTNVHSLHLCGVIAHQRADYDQALNLIRKSIALDPETAFFYSNLGDVLRVTGRMAQAADTLRRALQIKPDLADAEHNLGLVLLHLGQPDIGLQHIEYAIALKGDRPSYYYTLTSAIRIKADDAHLLSMKELHNNAAAMNISDRIFLHFSLGKALSDIGDYEQAFQHILAGNALKRETIVYNESETLGLFERIQSAFSMTDMMQQREVRVPAAGPIFIVGMPRSGTSLIEQILASHSQVFGAGELELFERTANQVLGTGAFPDLAATFQRHDLKKLGSAYLTELQAMAPEASRLTDKMPLNFLFCGLIHMALPQARIIHCIRDPIDTCLSCFSHLFAGAHPYSYNLGELGRYYGRYQRLMEHWRHVLPDGIMLDVHYEDIVSDLEGQTRRILAHCDLEWSEACLSFYKTDRAVGTTSKTQVRQPLYKTAIGRWRPDGSLLAPLIAGLAKSKCLDGYLTQEAKKSY